jgi:two-component system response regulator YesN
MKNNAINEEMIRAVEQYIVDHLEDRITITDLIRLFNLSKTSLVDGFKILYGTGIHQYHLRKSMEHAKTKLMEGEQIKVIASQLGYKHLGNFTRAFKNIHQGTPQSYKVPLDNEK